MPLHRRLSDIHLLIVLLGLLATGTAAYAGIVTVGPGELHRNLGRDISVFVDTSNRLTVAEVSRLPDSAFAPSTHDTPNFSFSRYHFWLRLKVYWQQPDRTGYTLWQQYSLNDYFTFYRPDGHGGYAASPTGDQLTFSHRELPVRAFGFPLTPRHGETDTYYIEIHGAGTINIDLQLTSNATAFADTETRHLILGLYYGALLALLLYNLVLFFSLRESVYLYYSLYVAGLGLAFFDVNGMAFRYFWPDWTWMNTGFLMFVFISLHALAQFTRKFLSLSQQWPLLDNLLQLAIIINAGCFISLFFMSDYFLFPASQRIALIVAVLCLIAGAGLWLRGYKPARYFTIASGGYMTGMIVYVLQNFGILPTSVLTNFSVQIGSSFEMVLLSLALADRINHMKSEKAAIEAASRQQLLEHNQTLELKVHERTQDLLTSLKAVREKHEALVATQEQLVQAEKMSSLGGLVAGVAHEINNPANFTRLAAENLERDIRRLQDFLHGLADDASDPSLLHEIDGRFSRLDQQLALVHDGTARLSSIVGDLRSFSRLDESEAKVASPDEGLEATLNLVRAQYGDRIAIAMMRENPEAEGFCYPAALNQVFMNLAVNACQAILARAASDGRKAPAGTLSVHTQLRHEDGATWWVAEFRDDGTGMEPAVMNRVFEPFFTTKDVGSGTGLGLSVSYGIIQKHRGDIVVSSTPGEGSCFRIRLPLERIHSRSQGVAAIAEGADHGAV